MSRIWHGHFLIAIRGSLNTLRRLPELVPVWAKSVPYADKILENGSAEIGIARKYRYFLSQMRYGSETGRDEGKVIGALRAETTHLFMDCLMWLAEAEPSLTFAVDVCYFHPIGRYEYEMRQGYYYSPENDTAFYVRDPAGDRLVPQAKFFNDDSFCVPTPPRYEVEITSQNGERIKSSFQECFSLDDEDMDFLLYNQGRALPDILKEAMEDEDTKSEDAVKDPVIVTAYPPFPEDIMAWYSLL